MTSGNEEPTAKFFVGQAVKLRDGVQVSGKRFGNWTEHLTLYHTDDHTLTVEQSMLVLSRQTSLSPTDAPSSAKHWEYRLTLTFPTTYISYKDGDLIEGFKGKVKHTHVTKKKGTSQIEGSLINEGVVVYLLRPFKYQAGPTTVTLEVGTAVRIASNATTLTGGLPGNVRPENAFYLIRTLIPERHYYTWRSEYWVEESRLTAA